jgi:phosphate transport system substrate-binding protein
MKNLFVFFVILGIGLTASATEITGAGSTFVYPILSRWADAYKQKTGVVVNYQSIGSGGGIKLIESSTVDFGASDKPLKSEDLAKEGLIQFPIINGAVVPVVHLSGVVADQLKLSGPLLGDIYLGKIKKWNDPAIAAENKGLALPDKAIVVIHRSDGSGTTFIFTNYLSKVSPTWQSTVGEDSAVKWPAGVGAKGNEGVASNVQQIDGSIGYVEYAYAFQNKMAYVQMKNGAGKYVKAGAESFTAAAQGADWAKAKDFYLILTDAPGNNSWPIAGSTFILMHKKQEKPAQAEAALKFFRWAFANGDASAKELHYVPIPSAVAKMIEKTWKESIKTADGASVATGF